MNKKYKVRIARLAKEGLADVADDLEDVLNQMYDEEYDVEFVQFVEEQGFVVCGRQPDVELEEAPTMFRVEGREASNMFHAMRDMVSSAVPGSSEVPQQIRAALTDNMRRIQGGAPNDEQTLRACLHEAYPNAGGIELAEAKQSVEKAVATHKEHCSHDGDEEHCPMTHDLTCVIAQLEQMIREKLQ